MVSYGITAILTMLLSLHAASMDIGNDSPNALLPKPVRRYFRQMICPAKLPKEEYNFRRRLLDCLLLQFADQQIFTGIALIVSGYLNIGRGTEWSEYFMHLPYGIRAQEAHFHLIVYLSCLSRSAAFGAMITAQASFRGNEKAYVIRMFLLLVFSIILVFAIPISRAFPFLFASIGFSGAHNVNGNEKEKTTEGKIILIEDSLSASEGKNILFSILFLFEIFSFWVCLRCLLSSTKLDNRIWNKSIWMFYINTRWLDFICNSTSAFGLQMCYFIVSATFVMAQKLRKDPTGYHCDLSANSEWGYGQTLALFVLGQLLFSTCYVYFGKNNSM